MHTTASAQVLADTESLSAELQRIMGHKVLDRVEAQLLIGSGTGQNIDGLYTQSTPIVTYENAIPDRIGSAINSMESAAYVPNVILMNPVDWFAIAILKDDEGRYLYGNPASPAQPSLWNRPVVTSPSVPVGYALVGDTNAAEVLEREGPSAIISRDHKDYRTRNLVLILAACRIGLALYDRLAFRSVDLSLAT